MEPCDGDVLLLARQIRDEFVRRKRALVPTFKLKSDRHGPVWQRAARMCLKEGVTDIIAFIEAQFEIVGNPYPNILSNRNALVRYKAFKEAGSMKGGMAIYVNTQMDAILSRACRGFDMRKFLVEPAERLCPVLAYAAAVLLGHKDIADWVKPSALEYIKLHPEIVDVLKEKYPRVPCPIN